MSTACAALGQFWASTYFATRSLLRWRHSPQTCERRFQPYARKKLFVAGRLKEAPEAQGLLASDAGWHDWVRDRRDYTRQSPGEWLL